MKLSLALLTVLVAGLSVGPVKAHGGGWGRGGDGNGWKKGGHHGGHGHERCITSLCQSATAGLTTCQDCVWKFGCVLKHNCMAGVTDCSTMDSTAVDSMKTCLIGLVPSISSCFA
nr:uncharacterized protein LOC113818759 [Penaeus vannamei]